MNSPIPVGLRHSQSIVVDDSLTVPAVSAAFTGFSDMPPVFATAYMVGFVEWSCIEALRPYLSASQRTVGTHIDLSHSAATPVGMSVTAEVELIAVEGKRLTFKVSCRDDVDVICEGRHERFVIDAEKFLGRVASKSQCRSS
ncbi:thioesterase family protein [Caballeronia sp. S22]|uniref:thioesterase family protein n=1 Tax=Caballeronia sp. S22 TaxID=3137182 RepID=UPI00353105A2